MPDHDEADRSDGSVRDGVGELRAEVFELRRARTSRGQIVVSEIGDA